MLGIYAYFYHNPLVALYSLQAATYAAAAVLSYRAKHKDLCACYGVSAVVHAGFAACHFTHMA